MLLGETDMTEVLLALADGDDTSALFKHLHNELLCCVLWQTADKHCLTAGRSLSGGRGRQVFEEKQRRFSDNLFDLVIDLYFSLY